MSVRCFGFLCALFFTAKKKIKERKPYLSMNSAILSHKMKDDEQVSNFKLTADCGLHHGGFVMASVSTFSGSSFFSTSMVT